MNTIAPVISEADRAAAYTHMRAGAYILAAIPDFQFKWMERIGIDVKTKRAIKSDVTDPAVLAVLNENPYEWSNGSKPTRRSQVRAEECTSKVCADAMRALRALGYGQREAKRALDGIPSASAEVLVKAALGRLTNTTPQQPVDLEAETPLESPTLPVQTVGYSD